MAVQTFRNKIEEINLNISIIETSEVTHTAEDAARTHDVPVSNIVKSLLITDGEVYYLVLVPGDKRLDLDKWQNKLDMSLIKMAKPDDVKRITGYSIGGVPPFGHSQEIDTYIEEGFDPSKKLLAAAGSANSVFKISLDDLSKVVLES